MHIASLDFLKWGDVLEIYLDVMERELGRRPKVHWTEDSTGLMETLGCTYQVQADRLFDRKFDSSLAERLCGEKICYTPMREGLARCLTEFLQGERQFRSISPGYEAWADRLAGERMPMEYLPGSKERMKYCLYRYAPQAAKTAQYVWRKFKKR